MGNFEFDATDYVVGIAVMMVPVVIGVVFAIKDKNKATREEYLLGGRNMHVIPVTLSIFITFMSAVSLIGIPSEVYMYGSMYIHLGIGLGLSYVVGVYTLVPLMYPLRITSIYQYLQMRYKSNAVRVIATIIGMITTMLHTGAIALLAPAFALQASVGIPMWMSIALVGGVGTTYTTIGGIKSVIWTDAFQTVIVFIGIFVMIVKGCMDVGSVGEVYELARDGGRTMMDNFDADPRSRMTFWGCIVGGTFLWLVNGFNQSTLQRLSAMKTLRKAKLAHILNFPIVVFYNIILVIVGNIVYAYFAWKRCDPFESGQITNKNQIAPYFVLDALGDIPGMAGLYVSTLCCGTLSTLSSGINALAANTVEDFLRKPLENYSEGKITLITKGFVLLHGIIIICIAYGAQFLSGPVTQMAGTVLSTCGSPLLGVFLMGAAVPWANKYGAMIGALVSITFNFYLAIGNMLYGRKLRQYDPVSTDMCDAGAALGVMNTTFVNSGYMGNSSIHHGDFSYSVAPFPNTTILPGDNSEYEYGFFLFDISYEWIAFVGTFVCVSVGLIVSLLTKSWQDGGPTTEGKLIFHFLRKSYGMDDEDVGEDGIKAVSNGIHIKEIRFTNSEDKRLNKDTKRRYSDDNLVYSPDAKLKQKEADAAV